MLYLVYRVGFIYTALVKWHKLKKNSTQINIWKYWRWCHLQPKLMLFFIPDESSSCKTTTHVHAAWVVRRWLGNQRNVELLHWPAKEYDMNPIEKLWANIVNVWKPQEERTSPHLLQHARTKWEVLIRKPELVFKLVGSNWFVKKYCIYKCLIIPFDNIYTL